MELESVPKATRRIGELNRSIKALGTPNIGAIEEYERVNGRYTYLSDQRADVEQAKGELTGVIDQLTQQMTEIFAQQFRLLNDSFQETFLELFGGGARPGWSWRMKRTSSTAALRSRCSPGQAAENHHPAVRRRKGLCGHRPVLRHSQGPPHPLLRDGRDRGRPGRGQRGALSPAICGASPGRPSSSSSPTGGAPWRRPTCSTASPCRSGASAGSSPSTSTIWPKS